MQDCKEPDILSLTTTVGSEGDAQNLAQALLASRLVACVQVEAGLVSHYRWQGALCTEPEVRLTLKTLPACKAALQAFLADHHPYEVPQLLWQHLRASAAYAAWVQAEVVPPQPA